MQGVELPQEADLGKVTTFLEIYFFLTNRDKNWYFLFYFKDSSNILNSVEIKQKILLFVVNSSKKISAKSTSFYQLPNYVEIN